jgi:acetyl esterase/lipase
MADVEALVARPRRDARSVVVYVNAATPLGIEEPAVGRFVRGLAAAGFVGIAPELPHVREGEVTPATVDALVAVARAAGPRVVLIGASTGAGLAILAAGDPRLADCVNAVAAVAPFASLKSLLLLATTGSYADRQVAVSPLLVRVVARSLVACAPEDEAVRALLANRDPGRFLDHYSELAPSTRELVRDLSPVTRIGSVAAPVEVVVSPADPFFPLEEALALTQVGCDVRLTVTSGLEHVRPRMGFGILPVLAMLERTLGRTVEPPPVPVLRPSPAL